MKTLLAVALMGLVLMTGARAEDPTKELKKFEGTWEGVSSTRDGQEIQEEKLVLTVKGEKYTLQMGKETIEGTHKLDPSKSPKTIDATRTSGPDKGKTILGIYELNDTTYKVCFAAPGKDRPTDFSSKKGSGNRLIEMKRKKL
jgi:uncharacterized protein (TIGR03067 family)